MKKVFGSAVLAILCLALGACERKVDGELAAMREQLDATNTAVEKLNEQMQDLSFRTFKSELRSKRYETAEFDPADSEGFLRIDSSVGTFAVSIEDVQPFADGTRVTLDLGNLTTADVTAAKLKLRYGRRLDSFKSDEGSINIEAWEAALREKEVSVVDRLRSGAWNRVVASLPGAPPAELGYLEVSIQSSQISLRQAR